MISKIYANPKAEAIFQKIIEVNGNYYSHLKEKTNSI
jgi:hypothetical protein